MSQIEKNNNIEEAQQGCNVKEIEGTVLDVSVDRGTVLSNEHNIRVLTRGIKFSMNQQASLPIRGTGSKYAKLSVQINTLNFILENIKSKVQRGTDHTAHELVINGCAN